MTSTLGYGGTHHAYSPSDLNLLALLTQDGSPCCALGANGTAHEHSHAQASVQAAGRKKDVSDRRPPVDPLMVAAASAAGPK